MNQKKIDEMIPTALKILRDESGKVSSMKAGKYEIDKVYFGYIAAFGPAVVQSGIAKTLAFYNKNSGESEGDRSVILDFIKQVFINNYSNYSSYSANNLLDIYDIETQKPDFTTLKKLALSDKILEAAIACKLSMNTYHAKENPGSEE
jgi:hypothetical protein